MSNIYKRTMQLVEVFKSFESLYDKEISVNGWIKTCRSQKKMVFIHISDGTTMRTLQIICSPDKITNFKEVSGLTTGSSISVSGILVKSPAPEQLFELSARAVSIYQVCPSTFPFQKVGLPIDFIRNYPHLRHRSDLFRAVFCVKSKIMGAIHQFFMEKNYFHVDLPVLTTNACEGGCQPLQVTSLLNDNDITKIPTVVKKHTNDRGDIIAIENTCQVDYTKDFFDNPVFLTVSNQLHLECFAHGLGKVYTITQASRGEPSQSTKHLATFNMLEWEFCFGKLTDNIDIAELCIKHCARSVLRDCSQELKLLNEFADKKLLLKLEKIVNEPFVRIEHRDAIELLRKVHSETPFLDEPVYEGDLSGEHEKYLVKHFDQPVVVMRYPKKVKAFYMPVSYSMTNDDGSCIEYVDCFDLLMDIGETVGGSMRISDENELIQRMEQNGINPKHLDWYIDLRRYGTVPHGGAGMGIERLTASLTGMANVKDCISFPITVHHCVY